MVIKLRHTGNSRAHTLKDIHNRIGIVFVHGIVGNNRIFDFLIPFIPIGCVVKYVNLDGHGGNALCFSRTSMSIWKRQVKDAVKEMNGVCERVIGVGHSMGCLLLLGEAVLMYLSGLFLLNPPLKIRLRSNLLRNTFKVTFGMIEGDEGAKAARDAYGISMDFNPLHYYGWPARYMELFAEIRRVRRSMPDELTCPVSVVLAKKDEMVSVSSADIFHDKANVQVVFLPESHHYLFSCEDRRAIGMAFTELLNRLGVSL